MNPLKSPYRSVFQIVVKCQEKTDHGNDTDHRNPDFVGDVNLERGKSCGLKVF